MLGIPPISSPSLWDSFLHFVTYRRELYLQYLYQNRHSLVFERRYTDLFKQELDTAIALQGLHSLVVEFNRTSNPLRTLMRRLHLHVGSTGDLWAALCNGCLLDDGSLLGEPLLKSCPFKIREWWDADLPPHTITSVFKEWEEAYLLAYTPGDPKLVEVGTGGSERLQPPAELEELLKAALKIMDMNLEAAKIHMDFISQSYTSSKALQSRFGLGLDVYL
ncbi:hypothetical protein DFP72DRAFT_1081034 [Ephemerocybe angulata]|uniref:Uncharacterized protein n=1 Tax=Ephemerocybe angulata TaxID=980116 RepID=A0A8H6LUB1_9AGAR|nr:hypothetical protein DFP72DRAFT_1081034 [Tulosesus angulatus]